jgi:hypothetical protein
MTTRLPEIWKQTRDLPPTKKDLVDRLFIELERVNQQLAYYEPRSNTSSQPYYQPPWFNSNARIQ